MSVAAVPVGTLLAWLQTSAASSPLSTSKPRDEFVSERSTTPRAHEYFHLAIARTRERIRGFANLPEGWNGHGAAALPETCIETALRVLNASQSALVLPNDVSPTGDESILFSFKAASMRLYLEVFSDGEIASLRQTGVEKRTDVVTLSEAKQDIVDLNAGEFRRV